MGDVFLLGLGLLFCLGVGYFCGRWPYDSALKRGQDTLGLVALITCTGVGLFGCFLALPVAWAFHIAILAQGTARDRDRKGFNGLAEEDYARFRARNPDLDEPPPGRYTLIGPMVVCNDCQHATSKDTDGGVPPECPECGLRFRKAGKKKPRKAMPVAQAVEVVDLTAERPG